MKVSFTRHGLTLPQTTVLEILQDNGGWMDIAALQKVRGADIRIKTLKTLIERKLITTRKIQRHYPTEYRVIKHVK